MARYRNRNRRNVLRRSLLQFETMEPRNLMAVYVVQANATAGGDGSPASPFATIALAVNAAKLNPGADEIQVGSGNYAETVSITDTADLTIRGDVNQRPIINGLRVSQPNSNFVFENLNIVSASLAGVFVNNQAILGSNGASGPFLRNGSVTLNNMNIEISPNTSPWNCVYVAGLIRFSASNLVLRGGRASLSDINTANLSQITVNASRTNALVANFVTQLSVNGLTAVQPNGTGVLLTNPTRLTPGFLNTQSVVSLSGVQIAGSVGNGLDAGTNISLTVLNSTFNSNAGAGILLNSVTTTVLDTVTTSSNRSSGITANAGGAFNGRYLVSKSNGLSGLTAQTTSALLITGGDFSNNTFSGV